MRTSDQSIACRTSVLRVRGRSVVCCEIDHFIPSGLSVHDLFAGLRPQLVAAIEDAAARNLTADEAPRAPRVQMDVGHDDPGFTLWVYSPAARMEDIEANLQQLQAITTRFVSGHPGQSRVQP